MSLVDVGHALRAFAKAEWQSRRQTDISLGRRLWLYRHGILSKRDVAWDLSEETVDDYLSDRQRSACERIDRSYGTGLKNKILFRRIIGSTHADLLPTAYGLSRDGGVVAGFGQAESLEDVLAVAAKRPIVSKPVDGAKGDLVRVIDGTDDGFRLDGQAVTRARLEAELRAGRDLLFEECVSQGAYATAIYAAATNTVRLITMVDRDGNPFVAAAMHRFGTANSGRIDNWNAGGLSAGIDVESGVIGQAAVPKNDGYDVDWGRDHPTTGAEITGTQVPEWSRVRESVLDLAGEYSHMWPYVGWDVVVTDDTGSVTVIEGQMNPGIQAIQAHQPLLRDERARRFYERYGVLD